MSASVSLSRQLLHPDDNGNPVTRAAHTRCSSSVSHVDHGAVLRHGRKGVRKRELYVLADAIYSAFSDFQSGPYPKEGSNP